MEYKPVLQRSPATPDYTSVQDRQGPFEKFQLPKTPPVYTPTSQRVGDAVGGMFASTQKVVIPEAPKPVAPQEAYPVAFGEIGNRPADKKDLEARVIFTTAVNRMREYAARGTPKTLDEVLTVPNQYQAHGGAQYNLYKAGTTSAPDTKKKQEVDAVVSKILNEIQTGTFKPLSDKAYYYKHNPDGTITYDDTRPLFK